MIADFVIFLINNIISIVSDVLNSIFGLLPNSPFNMDNIDISAISEYVSYLNWILPLDNILIITMSWLVAISIYYVYQIIMRWIRAIE